MIKKITMAFMCSAAMLLAGCSGDPLDPFGLNANKELGPAGFWKTDSRGETWVSANDLLSLHGGQSITGVGITRIVHDPTDEKGFYLLTSNSGLLYSFAGANGWQGTLSGLGTVRALAVHPQYRCTVYAGVGNSVYKTVDCGRAWARMYADPRKDSDVISLVVDSKYNETVYAALKNGDIVRSVDSGNGWNTVYRHEKRLRDMRAGRTGLYVLTEGDGISVSKDVGTTWTSFSNATERLVPDMASPDDFYVNSNENVIIVQSARGIVRTDDAGGTWSKYNLISNKNTTNIQAFAVNERNPNQLHYVMEDVLYSSMDNGETWKTNTLPSNRSVGDLYVDRTNENVLYIGFEI